MLEHRGTVQRCMLLHCGQLTVLEWHANRRLNAWRSLIQHWPGSTLLSLRDLIRSGALRAMRSTRFRRNGRRMLSGDCTTFKTQLQCTSDVCLCSTQDFVGCCVALPCCSSGRALLGRKFVNVNYKKAQTHLGEGGSIGWKRERIHAINPHHYPHQHDCHPLDGNVAWNYNLLPKAKFT